MTDAERMRRYRAKVRALREMERAQANPSNPARSEAKCSGHGMEPTGQTKAAALADAGTSAAKPAQSVPATRVPCTPPPAALDLLAGEPDAVAMRILKAVPTDRGIEITAALQRRLWQHGSWAPWRPSIIS
jgi:hypothetical protein